MSDPPPEDWPALMARAQDGDRAAYARLLRAVLPLLRRVAGRALARDSEDAVQDILLSVHQVRHSYDPGRPFLPWLLAIARARIADRQRVQVRRGRREEALDESHETFSGDATNLFLDAGAVTRAVARLPAGQRQAIEMVKLKEMSLQDAAAATGQSVTALKVATHRAIHALRRMLMP